MLPKPTNRPVMNDQEFSPMAKKSSKATTKTKSKSKQTTKSAVRRSPIPKPIAAKATSAKKSPVRKTTVPRTRARTASEAAAPAAVKVAQPRTVTYEMIATRAYFISQSGFGGSEFDNWLRAEWELNQGTV